MNAPTPRTLELLDKLIAFDSVSRNSNLDLIDFAQSVLDAHGFRTTRIPDPTADKAGLFAVLGPDDGGILLSGHTDVVPVDGQIWQYEPFRLTSDGSRLFGRGTTDMKGFVASALAAAERAASRPLTAPLKLVLSYDEEIGCVGITHMREALAPMLGRPRACVVGEPTEMAIATAHKGKIALRATCHGTAGHSALAPKFVNALHLAAAFVTEMQALQETLARSGACDPAFDIPFSTVHVGTLNGGTALNIVPDRAALNLEIRHLVHDDADVILAKIKAAARRIAEDYQNLSETARIDVETQTAYPGLDTSESAQVVAWAREVARTEQVTKVAFGTEAGVFDQMGVPTVVCGPGSMAGQGHQPNEYLTHSQLGACDAMMDRILDTLQ